MEGRVTPRAIAYAATLVGSSITDWSFLFMFSLLACLQSACRFTMGWFLQQLQLPKLLQLHHRFLRVWQSWQWSTRWPSFEVVESVNLCPSPVWIYVSDSSSVQRQVFPDHIATVVKSRKSRMKLISQRQARVRPSEGHWVYLPTLQVL